MALANAGEFKLELVAFGSLCTLPCAQFRYLGGFRRDIERRTNDRSLLEEASLRSTEGWDRTRTSLAGPRVVRSPL
jgi:hypothetical protein